MEVAKIKYFVAVLKSIFLESYIFDAYDYFSPFFHTFAHKYLEYLGVLFEKTCLFLSAAVDKKTHKRNISSSLVPAVLVAVVVHGHQTLEVVLVSALRQPSHRLSPGHWSHAWTLVPGGTSQRLHADGAILPHATEQRTSYFLYIYEERVQESGGGMQ